MLLTITNLGITDKTMINRKELLNEFHRLFAKTTGTMYLNDIAESINFAINYVPILLKAYPDDDDLPWMIRSFMRRAFRNAVRVTVGVNNSEYQIHVADDLAKKAGFHHYHAGDIVSIFDCMECDIDGLINEDFKLSE